jgi:hypothetical protein
MMENPFLKVKTLDNPEMENSIPLWSGSDMKQKNFLLTQTTQMKQSPK